VETLNATDLGALTLKHWRPVQLELDGEPLALEECLRLLPGKRIAARGRYGDAIVFAKVFFESGHQRLAEREMNTLRQLQDQGVQVPEPLAVRRGTGLTVMLTEWLEGGTPVADALESKDETVLQSLLSQIDHMYRAGWYQRDLHLDNFVWLGGRVRVLDAGAMAALPTSRFRRNRLVTRNLALLCAQASLDQAGFLRSRIEGYFECSGRRQRQLARAIRHARNRRIRRARRKWLRSCSALHRTRLEGGILLLDRGQEWNEAELSALLRHPESATLIKQGSRIHVYGTRHWVIKEYQDSSLRARVKQWLCLDSDRRSWVMGWTFSMLGVPTPRPVAWLRERRGRSVLIYPRLAGPRLSELMEQEPNYAHALTPQVLGWLGLMGEAGCWHGDTKAQNVLIVNESPWLIDLDAAGWSRWPWRSHRRNRMDVRRFRANRTQFVPVEDHRLTNAEENRETQQ
jgi:tRNA A-37 threonylcarbamoyl transferase component Bud32